MRDPKPDVVTFLLQNGADANTTNGNGDPLLFAAIQKEQLQIATQLLGHGADLNARNARGETPLDYAVKNRMYASAHALLLQGGQTTQRLVDLLGFTPETLDLPDDRDWTPLTKAIRDAELGRVQILLDAGANIETMDSHRTTPVMFAAKGYGDGILEVLLDHGANLETRDFVGFTPLHYAVDGQRIERVKAMLAQHVNLFSRDNKNRTPRMLAEEIGPPEVISLMRRAEKAVPKPRESDEERQRIDWLWIVDFLGRREMTSEWMRAARNGDSNRLRRWLAEGVWIDERGPLGVTALMIAAAADNMDAVTTLLDQGANLQCYDDRGRRALEWAQLNANKEMVRMLQDKMGIPVQDEQERWIDDGRPDDIW